MTYLSILPNPFLTIAPDKRKARRVRKAFKHARRNANKAKRRAH